jgi:hypothetical protein
MGSDSTMDYSDPTLGGYNNLVEQNPGYAYGGAPSDAYLQSILDPMQPSYMPQPDLVNPYTGQPYGMSGAQPFTGSVGGSNGLSIGKILGGLGGLATALGPGLAAAGQLAANALNQRPLFRNTPYIQAPAARTEGGTTRPLSLGGQVMTNDPLTNYAKLIQGMR